MLDFDLILSSVTLVFFGPKNPLPQSLKSILIFPVKGRGDNAFVLTYLDRLIAKAFLHIYLLC